MNIEEKYSQNSQEFAYLGLMEEMRMEALLLALLQEGDSALEERAMEYGDKIIQLKDEIRDTEMLLERLRRLLADYGKSDNILQEIAAGQRLELTEGMDVLIDGKKISMTPLPKALFLLFWRHPEGICFKDMSDYREELVELYGRTSRSDDPERFRSTIDRLIDLDSNSLDTQRYLLKRQLEAQMNPSDAAMFCIRGSRGEKKVIPASRRRK